jgi:hypothetical protein
MHVGGAGVTEEVTGTGFVDTAASEELFDPVAEVGWGDAGAITTEKERSFVRNMVEQGARFTKKYAKPGCGSVTYGKHTKFSAFAATDGKSVCAGIIIADVELAELGATDAGGVEKFEHGAVTQAEGVGGIGQGEQLGDFFRCKGLGEGAGLFAGEVEVGGGVGGNEVLAAEPGEEAADAAKAGDLSVDDEGFVAAWGSVMVKEMLIGGEVGAGDLCPGSPPRLRDIWKPNKTTQKNHGITLSVTPWMVS